MSSFERFDFLDISTASSASEAGARWWGNVVLFGDDGNRRGKDYSDRAVSRLRELVFTMPPIEVARSFVTELTSGIQADYDVAPTAYTGVKRGESIATDGNSLPTPILGRAIVASGLYPAGEPLGRLQLILPADGLVEIENDTALAKLGRMTPRTQIWPPNQNQ